MGEIKSRNFASVLHHKPWNHGIFNFHGQQTGVIKDPDNEDRESDLISLKLGRSLQKQRFPDFHVEIPQPLKSVANCSHRLTGRHQVRDAICRCWNRRGKRRRICSRQSRIGAFIVAQRITYSRCHRRSHGRCIWHRRRRVWRR